MYLSELFPYLFIVFGATARVNYTGYKVYVYYPMDFESISSLNGMLNDINFYTLIEAAVPRTYGEIMVSPWKQKDFENLLKFHRVKYKILIEDVEEKFRQNGILAQSNKLLRGRPVFNAYYSYKVIDNYLNTIGRKNANYVNVAEAGKSHEGRSIKYVRITYEDNARQKNTTKPIIFIESGMFSREWLDPIMAMYIIDQLIEERENNQKLLQLYDWIILPLANPDGYEYTQTTDRMWSKTRSVYTKNCFGVDLTRNFDWEFGTVRASVEPCSLSYIGPKSFSEPESQIVRKLIDSVNKTGWLYLSIRSYGKYLLHVWTWTSTKPFNFEEIEKVCKKFVKGAKVILTAPYRCGSPEEVIYKASGSSIDYAYGRGEFQLAYMLKLGGDGHGFDPCPLYIRSIAGEAWSGIKAMADPAFSGTRTLQISHNLFLSIFASFNLLLNISKWVSCCSY